MSRIEMAEKRVAAREMVVENGMEQKKAAKAVGVTERTISKWAIEENWKELIKKQAEKKALHFSIIDGFMDYLELQMPQIHRDVQKHWGKYMKTVDIQGIKGK